MVHIKHNLTIDALPGTVYNAITTQEGIQNWWTVDTHIKLEVGSIAEFIFGDQYHNKMKIVDLQPNRRVEWHCLEGDPQWIDTSIIFELESHNEQTLLRFNHKNWQEAADFYAYCNNQWGKYMMSLKNYYETGVGNPFIPKSLNG